MLIGQFLIGQFIPLPSTTAKWSERIDFYNGSPPSSTSQESGFVHEMKGDTIIDGIEYKQILQRRTWSYSIYVNETPDTLIVEENANNIQEAPKLIGVMRQDTVAKKVYFRRLIPDLFDIRCIEPILDNALPFNEEILLYDFDMMVGDTVFLGGNNKPVVISNIDSIQYNDGIYRKRYHPQLSGPQNYSFIEGIGTNVTLFAPLTEEFVEGNFCYLECFSVDDEYIIGDGIYNCDSIDVLNPIVEIDLETKINIYPNPFGQYLEIGIKSLDYKNFRIVIFNSLGQQKLDYNASSNEATKINTADFSAGMYLLSIYDGPTLISTQKIIKSN